MRYTGPKNKISRRENVDLGMKTPGSKSHATLLRKINIGPGQHGGKGRKKVSERGRQLREKQKIKFIFGLSEKQLSNYFAKASRQQGNTGENLVKLLERRLDNVIYRMGFAPTRAAARQLVNHKHFNVNGKVISVASYQLVNNEEITFRKEKSAAIPAIAAMFEKTDMIIPPWVEVKGKTGKIVMDPMAEDVEKMINLRLVVEYYSK